MKRTSTIYIIGFILSVAFTSCQLDSARPIRNVRFDGNLLNRLQIAPDSLCACNNYDFGKSGKKLGMLNLNQILVEFDKNVSEEQRSEIVKDYNFLKGLSHSVQTNSATLHTLQLKEGFNCNQVEYILSVLEEDPAIQYSAPYFIAGANSLSKEVGLSNELLVTLEEGFGQAALEEFLNTAKAEIVDALGNNTYLVKVNKGANKNALEMASFLSARKGIAHAEPDFVLPM
ncbi:S8 family serine peptidase [Pontibacter harenae]|uniref:S8 family serine peptidase n=1 Tax=Pontibacter harenae TaxID=2894083 RepID=UPI001E440B0F|nr:hypothetical protein [Pontibacter harenae]MCC9166327.1 hypothetical protein [Pontibacter harenae]